MKKSVILILIAVYVISIGIVGTIGLNVRVYAPNIKPTSIEITQLAYFDKINKVLDYSINEKGIKHFSQIRCKDDVLVLDLIYIIGPSDATDKTVIYSFDQNPNIKEDNGRLIFSRPESEDDDVVAATITISPKSNATISDSVYISVRFI